MSMIDSMKKANKFVIYPENKARQKWELLVTVLLLLTLIVTPWNLAFTVKDSTG